MTERLPGPVAHCGRADSWPFPAVCTPAELELHLKIPVAVGQDTAVNEPPSPEIPQRIDVPGKRMKTNYAETGSALDRLRANMARRENRLLPDIIAVVTAIPGVLTTAQ